MKSVVHVQGLSYLHSCKALFQSAACLILVCMLGNLAIVEPVWAQTNVVRYALTSPSGTDEDTIYYLSLDGNTLGPGQDAVLSGVMQSQGSTTRLKLNIPFEDLASVTLSPTPPTAPHRKGTYAIYQDGLQTSYQLVMTTYLDNLKPDTLLHSGTVVDTATGRSINFVALNDPIDVVVIVAIVAAILCIISVLTNDCTEQAAAACGDAGVKSVTANVSFGFWSGCDVECSWECNGPDAVPVPTVVGAEPLPH